MTRLDVPSRDFWTITPFHLDIPDSWSARQTAEHLVFAQAGDDADTTLSVRWSRVPARLGLTKVAQGNTAQVRRIDPDVRIGYSHFGKMHGSDAYSRVSEFAIGDEGRRTAQTYVALFGPRLGADRPVELFEITGHLPPGDNDRLNELRSISASFHFDFPPQRVVAQTDRAGA